MIRKHWTGHKTLNFNAHEMRENGATEEARAKLSREKRNPWGAYTRTYARIRDGLVKILNRTPPSTGSNLVREQPRKITIFGVTDETIIKEVDETKSK